MIDFPDSPVLDEEFTSGGTTWRWDGIAWVPAGGGGSEGGGGSSAPTTVAFTFSFGDKPPPEVMNMVPLSFPVSVPANLAGSTVFHNMPPAAEAVFTIFKQTATMGTTELGTITLPAMGEPNECTLAGTGGELAAGDALVLWPPPVQDATLAMIGVTILAERA
jgi:hypothetical protein